jgi:hypothetical protein
LVWAKSPVAATPVMVRGAAPLFVRVTLWAVLGAPTSRLPKVTLAPDRPATVECWYP